MTKQQEIHYIEVFVGAFVTFIASSGLDWLNMPSESSLEKVGLAALVAGVVAVYQQIAKPTALALKSKLTT